MEKQRAEKGLVTIHSACVEKEGQAILLLGRSGSGKTKSSKKKKSKKKTEE